MLGIIDSSDNGIAHLFVLLRPTRVYEMNVVLRLWEAIVLRIATPPPECVVVLGKEGPSLALLSELKSELPKLAFLAGTHGHTVTGSVRANVLPGHAPQESNCMLPLLTFLASADCCAITNDTWCHSSLALL